MTDQDNITDPNIPIPARLETMAFRRAYNIPAGEEAQRLGRKDSLFISWCDVVGPRPDLLSLEHEQLWVACPLYRLYLMGGQSIGSGALPLWFVHRSHDWAWRASAVHDFWYSHEWIAEFILPGEAQKVVNERWNETTIRLAGDDRILQRQQKIGYFMIVKVGGFYWKPG